MASDFINVELSAPNCVYTLRGWQGHELMVINNSGIWKNEILHPAIYVAQQSWNKSYRQFSVCFKH